MRADILGATIQVTVSVGVATTEEIKGSDSAVLLQRAAEALRLAKSRGRDRVELTPASERRAFSPRETNAPKALE